MQEAEGIGFKACTALLAARHPLKQPRFDPMWAVASPALPLSFQVACQLPFSGQGSRAPTLRPSRHLRRRAARSMFGRHLRKVPDAVNVVFPEGRCVLAAK